MNILNNKEQKKAEQKKKRSRETEKKIVWFYKDTERKLKKIIKKKFKERGRSCLVLMSVRVKKKNETLNNLESANSERERERRTRKYKDFLFLTSLFPCLFFFYFTGFTSFWMEMAFQSPCYIQAQINRNLI